jgi:hypothetical protein
MGMTVAVVISSPLPVLIDKLKDKIIILEIVRREHHIKNSTSCWTAVFHAIQQMAQLQAPFVYKA